MASSLIAMASTLFAFLQFLVRYEGEWVNDQKHGHGEEHYADGGRFSGSPPAMHT